MEKISTVHSARAGELTIRVDRLLCVGFGDCIDIAPGAFALDDEGIVLLRPELADSAREILLEACAACPVDALEVTDGEGRRVVP